MFTLNISTILARIANFFNKKGGVASKLDNLKTSIEADYDRVQSAASKKLAAGLAEVRTIAHEEVVAVEAALAAAKRRAQALLGLGVLGDTHAARAVAVANASIPPAGAVTATTTTAVPATPAAKS